MTDKETPSNVRNPNPDEPNSRRSSDFGPMSQESVEKIQRSVEALLLDLLGKDNAVINILKQVTDDVIKNPYKEEAYALFSGDNPKISEYSDLVTFYQMAGRSVKDQADELTGGGIGRLNTLEEKIRVDHYEVIAAVQSEKITPADLGTEPDYFKSQLAYQHFLDINSMYEYIYEITRRGYWPIGKKLAAERKRATLEAQSLAIERGAVMGIDRAFSFTSDDLKDAISLFKIKELPASVSINDAFSKDTGRLKPSILEDADLTELSVIELGFLLDMMGAFFSQSGEAGEPLSEVSLYIPKFLKDIGKDYRGGYSEKRAYKTKEVTREDIVLMRRDALAAYALPFENKVGVTPNGSWYRVLTIQKYDAESEIMTFSSPYIYELLKILQGKDPKNPSYHQLLHSKVATQPNQAAVEIANQIIIGLLERGTHYVDAWEREHKRIRYRVKYSTLLERCPMAKRELDAIWNSGKKTRNQAYNEKLRQLFTGAFNVIEKHSDIDKKFKNLKFDKVKKVLERKNKKTGEKESYRKEVYRTPTRSTVSQLLVITHEGKPNRNLTA